MERRKRHAFWCEGPCEGGPTYLLNGRGCCDGWMRCAVRYECSGSRWCGDEVIRVWDERREKLARTYAGCLIRDDCVERTTKQAAF
jgi:hypothetical protein